MTPRTWRQWHRWIGFPAAIFLLFAAVTGITLVCVELFSADEAERERLRTVVSPVVTVADAATVAEPFQRAFATAARQAPGAPVDKVEWQCKAEPPTVTLFLGKPSGGEDRRLVCDARTGALLATADYVDKPFLHRLHSGEAFGDGGLGLALGWGASLVLLVLSGLVIYWQMRKRDAKGWRRVFW
jgi:uncharacterized iron-regulated membrane protein